MRGADGLCVRCDKRTPETAFHLVWECEAKLGLNAAQIFSPKGSCRPPWEAKLNLIRVRSDLRLESSCYFM